jgi:hypothetical protein
MLKIIIFNDGVFHFGKTSPINTPLTQGMIEVTYEKRKKKKKD